MNKNAGETLTSTYRDFQSFKSTYSVQFSVCLLYTSIDLSKIEAGYLELHQNWFNLTELLDKCVAEYARLLWAEIAAASRTDPMISSLIDCAQTGFARPLTHSEMEKLVNLYVQEGFAPETVMLCVAYVASRASERWPPSSTS